MLQSFLQSTEFYVVLLIVAAAVIAVVARPKAQGAVKELLVGADIMSTGMEEEPSVAVECGEDGRVTIARRGIEGLRVSGAVSARVEIKGSSARIYERFTPGSAYDDPADLALMSIVLPPGERCYIRYESDHTSTNATLSFRNLPGVRAEAPLKK